MDNRIKELFLKMINSPEKIKSVCNSSIIYDNGIDIVWNNEINNKSNETLNLSGTTEFILFHPFKFNVNEHIYFAIFTPYRKYDVPDFTDRIEYANVLNTIDKSLAAFEERKLTEYEKYFE